MSRASGGRVEDEPTTPDVGAPVRPAPTKSQTPLSLSDTGSSPDLPDPLVGLVFADKYRILGVIARGGMGRIYRAEQIPLARTVALKVLAPRHDTADDPEFHRRFLREAGALGRLRHPNTVAVFDYGHVPEHDLFFMVMEYVDGQPLSTAIKADGPFSPTRALRIAYEIARSLGEAHAHGMVHRDLKPSNVMLVDGDEGESVKVLDFGIVKLVGDDDAELTRADRLVGSPRYMAPEQIRHTEVDGRTDLYAIGVLLFEMLTSRPLFRANTAMGTLLQHLQEPVPTFASRDVDVPAPVEKLVRRLLEKEPAMRPPDVEAFKAECRAVLSALGERQGATFAGPRPTPSPEGPRSWEPPPTVTTGPRSGPSPDQAQSQPTLSLPASPSPARAGAALVVALLVITLPVVWWLAQARPADPGSEAQAAQPPVPSSAPEPPQFRAPPPNPERPAERAAEPEERATGVRDPGAAPGAAPATPPSRAPTPEKARTAPASGKPPAEAPPPKPAQKPGKQDDLDILMER